MKRNVDINAISDGRLYSSGGYGESRTAMTVRDVRNAAGAWEVRLFLIRWISGGCTEESKRIFSALMGENYIELGVVDGMILPNLKMDGARDACPFLDDAGQMLSAQLQTGGSADCFPLEGITRRAAFKYFIQIHEWPEKKTVGKVKIKKWLGIPNLKAYESYIMAWHDFLNECEECIGVVK